MTGGGLVPGHKQPFTSPPPPPRRPGPSGDRACSGRVGLRGSLALVGSLSPALHSQSRRRALAHSLRAASTSLLPILSPRTSPKAGRPDTHAYSRGRPARADTVPAPRPRFFRGVAPPLPEARLPVLPPPRAPPPRVLNNCPLSRPTDFPRP